MVFVLAMILFFTEQLNSTYGLVVPSWTSSILHVLEHLASPPLRVTPLEDLTNVRIPGPSGVELLAHVATPTTLNEPTGRPVPVIILIHEFFGLNPSIIEKAKGLADDLGCVVVAPDTFRGTVTDFIPKAIWLALSTPQERVNDDLDAICTYIESGNLASVPAGEIDKLVVMGFCYGGGKAIRYSIQRRVDAATVVFYGKPVTEVDELRRLKAPVCGVFGRNDAQFSMPLLDSFRQALNDANVENDIRIYDGVGHAFWTDMEQVQRGDEPQTGAYNQCTDFLRSYFECEL